MTEAYCVKCRKKVQIKNPKDSLTVKNVKMIKGACPNCNTNVCRIGGI